MSSDTDKTCSWYDPSCALGWLKDEFQAFSLWVYDSVLSGIAFLFESIPAPDFMLRSDSILIPQGVSWAVSPFQLEFGIGIIVSAYIGRFIIRRLPFVG